MINSIVKFVVGKMRLIGNTDGTLIGNTGDRLKVTMTSSPFPDTTTLQRIVNLTNGVSRAMNVLGTLVTPVYFTYTAVGTEYLSSIRMFLLDNGVMNPDDFGAIAGLTNGITLEIRSQGILYSIQTMVNNADLAMYSDRIGFSPTTSGFLNNTDLAILSFDMRVPIRMDAATGDYVRVCIRDNLVAVDLFRACAVLGRSI